MMKPFICLVLSLLFTIQKKCSCRLTSQKQPPSSHQTYLTETCTLFKFVSIGGDALQCYTCVGTNNEECNRQGSEQCPGHSDACAIITGQSSGIMKSCSYKSFCERARREGSRAPGVSVHCCYSNNCNAKGLAARNSLSTGYFSLLFSAVLWHLLFNLE